MTDSEVMQIFRDTGALLEGRTNEALPLLLKGLDAFRATGAALTLPRRCLRLS